MKRLTVLYLYKSIKISVTLSAPDSFRDEVFFKNKTLK